MAGDIEFLLELGVLTAAALVIGLLFVRVRLPIVSAQVLAGMLVGPYVLGLVTDQTVISEVASIGIVLLLFVLGLELDPVELRKSAKQIIFLTLVEVAISLAFGLFASFVLGLGIVLSIIFAVSTSISSTAILGKIILERKTFQAQESKTLVGLMVTEDIVAVGFLIVLSTFLAGETSTPEAQLTAVLVSAFGGLGLVLAGYVVARYFATVAIDYLSSYEIENEEIPTLFALALGILFAVFAAYLGYSPGIGAFIIGVSIRGKQSKFLYEKLTTVKDLFLVIFFVSMGSLINPFPALAIGLPIILVILLLLSGKFVAGMAVGTILKRLESGIQAKPRSFGAWLVPRGEFSFVIGQFALAAGLIGNDIFSLIGLTVLITAIAGPILQRLIEPRGPSVSHLLRPSADKE